MNIFKNYDGKNHNFGKLVEGVLDLAPAALIVGNEQYICNSAARYASAGYLPITYADKPEDTDEGHYEAVYTESDGKIVQSWEFVFDDTSFWDEDTAIKIISDRTNLTELTIPEGIKKVEAYAFYNMNNLRFTKLPDSIESIGHSAFYWCDKLVIAKLPENLISIDESAFRQCNLTLSELPPKLETIANYAFLNQWKITLSVIPATIKSLGTRCFDGCADITEITFKGTPTSIGTGVFNNCTDLKTINVPWSQTDSINANAPWGATNATINYNYVESGA